MKSGAAWIALFCAYFLVQALLRPLYGPALELDEAEAFWFARELLPGYGAQPPLYFWLQWGFFQLFGENAVALALLKAVLLSGTFVLVFSLLRSVLPVAIAGTATLALVLVPELSWEAQRALTHTVLVLFMSALTLALYWRALNRDGLAGYVLLGLAFGLGTLSKLNFAFLPLGITLGVLAVPQLRTRLRVGGLVLAVAVAALVMTPYLLWSLAHPDLAGSSMHKLQVGEGGAFAARLSGLGRYFAALLALLALPVLLAAGAFFRRRSLVPAERPLLLVFMAAGAVGTLAVLLAAVLIVGMGEVRSRWLMPLAWPLVPAFVAALLLAAPARWVRPFAAAFAALWLLVSAALFIHSPNSYRAADFSAVDRALPPDLPVMASNHWVLGNLALLPSARTLYHAAYPQGPAPGTDVVLIAPRVPAEIANLRGYTLKADPVPLPIPRGARVMNYSWQRAAAP